MLTKLANAAKITKPEENSFTPWLNLAYAYLNLGSIISRK
jgi:hypothetical protein